MQKKKSITVDVILLICVFVFGELAFHVLPVEVPEPEHKGEHFEFLYIDSQKPLFKKKRVNGQKMFVANRSDLIKSSFYVEKPKNTVRIFILGGSVCMHFGSKPLEKYLKNIWPDKNFEVINCALPGYSSAHTKQDCEEIFKYSPDIVVVISGNNEGGMQRKISPWKFYLKKLLLKSAFYRKLFLTGKKKKHEPPPTQTTIERYQANLTAIANEGKKHKTPVLLCSIPVHSAFAPASFWDASGMLLKGRKLLLSGKIKQAEKVFNTYLQKHQKSMFGHYFAGCVASKQGKHKQAKQFFNQAVEFDYPAGRASTKSNAVVKNVCDQYQQSFFVDIDKAIREKTATGICGADVFTDKCHVHLDLYRFFSAAIANTIIKAGLLGKPTNPPSAEMPISPREKRNTHPFEATNLLTQAVWGIFESNTPINERSIYIFRVLFSIAPDMAKNFPDNQQLRQQLLAHPWFAPALESGRYKIDNAMPKILAHAGCALLELKCPEQAVIFIEKALKLGPSCILALTLKELCDKSKLKKKKPINATITQ